MVHGEPGTGKSWLYHVLSQFFDMLGFVKGVHYAFAAFQGRMARAIGDTTLHRLVGLGLHTSGTSSATESLLFNLQSTLRWLVIDEISMVSPRLHALVESRLRTYTQLAGTYKHAPDGHVRSFGGLNVIECGDFWQLPPPGEGHSLMTIPPWLDDTNEKVGSNDGFDYLKSLVLTDAFDLRLQDDLFANAAAAIVATNDLKYAINKHRAQLFAVQHGKRLTWCPAVDKR